MKGRGEGGGGARKQTRTNKVGGGLKTPET